MKYLSYFNLEKDFTELELKRAYAKKEFNEKTQKYFTVCLNYFHIRISNKIYMSVHKNEYTVCQCGSIYNTDTDLLYVECEGCSLLIEIIL